MKYLEFSLVASGRILFNAFSKQFDIQDDFSPSTLSFSLDRTDAANTDFSGAFVKVKVDGVQLKSYYIINGNSVDYVTSDGIPARAYSASSIHSEFEDSPVVPSAWPNPVPSGHDFQNATPGTIIKTLVTRVQQLGYLQNIDTSTFTGTHDSNGVTWPSMMDRSYTTGDTILSVIQGLYTDGMCDPEMDGYSLNVYVAGGLDKTLTPDKVVFRVGQNLTEGSTTTDASDFYTDIFAIGDGSAAVMKTRPASYNVLGRRRMRFAQYAGITDVNLLGVLADLELDQYNHIKTERSCSVSPDFYTPFVDYNIHNLVPFDKGDGSLENIRIKQISVTQSDEDGSFSVGITLGDILEDADQKLKRRLDAITGANAGGGAVPSDKTDDKMPPAPPVSISFTTTPYLDDQTRRKVLAIINWPPVTTNADGTPAADIDHYEIQSKVGNAADFGPVSTVPTAQAVVSGYDPSTKLQVKVRTIDTSGLASTWTTSSVYTMIDNTPSTLKTPSTPTVTAKYQNLTITWDGKDNLGNFPTLDCVAIEVHLATSSATFTPTSATRIGVISYITSGVGGFTTVTNLLPTTTYYVRFIALGKNGTVSPASTSGSATTEALIVDPAVITQINTDVTNTKNTVAQNVTDLNQAKTDLYSPGGTVDLVKTTLTGQITSGDTATLNAAKSDAQAKADAAKLAATTAAAADAQTKANAAQQAAVTAATTAAAADAQAKADAATAAATAAAAADAKTKADAAQSAATAAAKTYADAQVSGASTTTLATAAADAQAKADAAKLAATTAAALDAQAKADAAKSAATTTAAADATTKANNAKQAAIDAAALDATAKANQVAAEAQSRGPDLVTNGTGYLGTNRNFTSSLTFTAADAPPGMPGAFIRTSGSYASIFSDDYIPVDPTRKYVLSAWARETASTGVSRFYSGFTAYDSQNTAIQPLHYWYEPTTSTTIAASLKPGDTTATVVSGAGWVASASQFLLAWNYTDTAGRVWPIGTYSRWTGNIASVSGNTITLSTAWTGPTLPVGHPVVNSHNGGNYVYCVASNATVPTVWTKFTSPVITGTTDGSKGYATVNFPPGTAKIKFLFLSQYTGSAADCRQAYSGISMSEAGAAQATADAAQTTASGKNTISWYTTAAPALAPGTQSGDIWNQYVIRTAAYIAAQHPEWTAAQKAAAADNRMAILASWQSDGTNWKSSALSETYLPQVNIGVGTYGELDGIRLKATSVQADVVVVKGSVDDTVIKDGAVTTDKIFAGAVTAGKVSANAITADKIDATSLIASNVSAQNIAANLGTFMQIKANNILAGNINVALTFTAGGKGIFGDPNGVNTTIDGTDGSVRTNKLDPDGNIYPSTMLGGAGKDLLQIGNDTNPSAAAITSNGDITANTVASVGDMSVGGMPLIGSRVSPGTVIRTNYFPTSQDFENGMVAPTYTGSCTAAISTAFVHSGTSSCAITATATATGAQAFWTGTTGTTMGVSTGDTVTLSAWMYIPSTVTQNANNAIKLTGGAFAATAGVNPNWTLRNQWQRVSVTATVTTVTGNIYPTLCAPATNGQVIYFDDVQLEVGSVATDAFSVNSQSLGYSYMFLPSTWIALEYTPAAPLGYSDTLSWGCVARAPFASIVQGKTITAGGSISPIGQFSVALDPWRSYQLVMHWRGYTGTTGSYSNVTTRFYMTNATDPNGEAPDPTTAGVALGQQSENFVGNTATGLDDQLTINFTTDDPSGVGAKVQYKFLLGIFANGNTFTPDTVNVPTQDNWVVTIFDTGRVPWPSPVTVPGAGTKRTYISTWNADNSRSWGANGSVYTISGSTTGYIRQGVTNGVQYYGAVSFGGKAVSGETTKTIAQAVPSGALIQKAEVFMHINWSADDTGQIKMRPLGANAVPSTMATPTGASPVIYNFNSHSAGAWIQVPTSWFTTTNNGVIIATPDWLFNNSQFAGAAHPTASWRPQVRLTYTR